MAVIIPFPVEDELHISASSVRVLHECMREYYFKYIQGIPRESVPEGMVMGSAIHKALAYFYLVLKQDGEDTPLGVLTDIVDEYLDKEEMPELKEEAGRLIKTFTEQGLHPSPKEILAVEQKFSLPLMDPETGENLTTVIGFWDLVTRNSDGSITVTDHKVVKRNDKAKATSPDLQMALYSWAAKQVFGATTVHLQYQDIIKNKTPKVDIKPITRTNPSSEETDAVQTLRSSNALVGLLVDQSNVEELMFPKKSWRCAGCGFRGRC
jgi:putative RecB family exonuclease